MFDVFDPIRKIGQRCLTQPMSSLPPDGRGEFDFLASVDRLFQHDLSSEFLEWEKPAPPNRRLYRDERWLNVSALQKAIRRGDKDRAVRHAMLGCQLDADHVFKRLAVCAFEDVGLGDLRVVAQCLAALGSKRFRDNSEPELLAAFLAWCLAGCAKSRLACECLSLVSSDAGTQRTIADWSSRSSAFLTSIAMDRRKHITDRMLAAWLLAGTRRFAGTGLPESNHRDRSIVMRAMRNERMPAILYYLADRGAARLSDAMFVSMLPLWQALETDSQPREVRNAVAKSTEIVGYASEAIDMHTRQGRRAISIFCSKNQEIRAELSTWPAHQRTDVARNSIFYCEGGLLDREIVFPWSEDIKRRAVLNDLRLFERENAEPETLLALISRKLPDLDRARRTAMTGSDQKRTHASTFPAQKG